MAPLPLLKAKAKAKGLLTTCWLFGKKLPIYKYYGGG
jgi:hypothetical protein